MSTDHLTSKEYIHRMEIGDKCTVIVTTISNDFKTTTTKEYSCDTWDEMNESDWTRKLKSKGVDELGLAVLDLLLWGGKSNDQKFSLMALNQLSKDHSIQQLAEIFELAKNNKEHFSYRNTQAFFKHMSETGYGEDKIIEWSASPFEICKTDIQEKVIYIATIAHGPHKLKAGYIGPITITPRQEDPAAGKLSDAGCSKLLESKDKFPRL